MTIPLDLLTKLDKDQTVVVPCSRTLIGIVNIFTLTQFTCMVLSDTWKIVYKWNN